MVPSKNKTKLPANNQNLGRAPLNKYIKTNFLITFFYRKSKAKQESRVALKLGNTKLALQESRSFAEL